MLPFRSLVYPTSTTPLRVKWKALHFMESIAPLKLMCVLKLLRYFVGMSFPSYLDILGNVKWFKTGTFLIPCYNCRLSSSLSRLQDSIVRHNHFFFDLSISRWLRWSYSTHCLLCSSLTLISRQRIDVIINWLNFPFKSRLPLLSTSS